MDSEPKNPKFCPVHGRSENVISGSQEKLKYRIVREVPREAQSGATVCKYGGWKICHMDHWNWQLTRAPITL